MRTAESLSLQLWRRPVRTKVNVTASSGRRAEFTGLWPPPGNSGAGF